MSREMWSQLKKFSDGDSLDAGTLNIPIGQLGDRTSYLYARLKELVSSGTMSSVILTGVKLSTETGCEPFIGNAVYLDNSSGRFAAAKASMSLYDDFTASDSAFTVGILQTKDGDSGNVLVYGSLNLNPGGSPFAKDNMIESGEEFRPGRYYLSSNEAGRLTAHPNGPLIYVCTIDGSVVAGGFTGQAVVNPQYLDIGTSHTHRTAVLMARPAGSKSTRGYLPLDETYTAAQIGPLALKFGGTWTADGKVDYSFYLDQGSADWPSGVVLRWKENGGSVEHSVSIPAPDAEVSLSNGLTVKLSMPASDSQHAYANLTSGQRTWGALTFPDAGKGWLDHDPVAILTDGSVSGLKVSLKAKLGEEHLKIYSAFPAVTQILTIGSIVNGTTFTYAGSTYEFTTDVEGYSGTNIPLQLGICLADSVTTLADALNKVENGTFAVFESNSGASAKLLAMDGATIPVDGTVVTIRDVKTGSSFNVVGATSVKAVLFDEYLKVISETPVVEGISSYSWKTSGNVSLMIYQDVTGTVSVPVGTIVSGNLLDEEPDAIYDYVIGMDPQISNYWPPIPPKSAALIVNGVEMDNKAILPNGPTVSFGKKTIHWFTDENGRKPWPEGFTSRSTTIDPAYDKAEVLHWVRGFQGATGPVTSLQIKSGSPLKILGYGTEDSANTGDLEISADFDFSVVNGGAPGFMVPKRASRGKLVAGPVVERIVGGAGVSIVSKAGCPDGQGTVVVALDNGAYRSQFSDVALENAEQSKIGMFPYIRLKGYSGTITSPSAFTATMRIPTNLPDGKYALRVFASVFGETGFSNQAAKKFACVKFAYNILPDFTAEGTMMYKDLKSSLLKPDSERTVLIPFGHSTNGGVTYNGFDPIFVTTDDESLDDKDDVIAKVLGKSLPAAADFALQSVSPELKPGYLLGIRISRAVTQAEGHDPYTGALGFINLSWSIVSTDDYGTVVSRADDLYARNTTTGLYHKVEAVTDEETGEVNLGIEQQGVQK